MSDGELDAKSQAWVDEKEPAYGQSADPERIAEIVQEQRAEGESARDAALREFDDQMTLEGVSRDRTGEIPPSLIDRFGIPPFTVLDTRQGYWQKRRKAWLSLGIESEIGRTENMLGFSNTVAIVNHSGTSVFDPVLCEIAYRWFAPAGGRVLDPFAGGSVRGVVAASLGLRYGGIELRAEQVEANRAQAERIFANGESPLGLGPVEKPRWLEGDAAEVSRLVSEPVDLLFTCPPYGDLERYSEDPRDLSTMSHRHFREMYADIIGLSLEKLRPDSFAAIVVCEIRDKAGLNRNFVADTIAAFEEGGASYYNDAILVNAAGSAPMRANRVFNGGRKLVRVHQNLLIFVKGDWKKAAARCQEVEA